MNYVSLEDDQLYLTVDDMVTRGHWHRNKVDLKYKEEHGYPINVPRYLETLYIRFIEA